MICLDNARVLVTGGCGFLGYHLIKRLLRDKHEVYVVDVPRVDTKRIRGFGSDITLLEADITNGEYLHMIAKEVNPDYAFHLAGYGVNAKDCDATRAIKVNVIGGANLVQALSGTGCKRLVNIGSSAEYGVKVSRYSETIKPTTIYGSSKAAATVVMHQLARQHKLPIVTLRPFNIYGEWEEPHKLFCEVMLDILLGRELNFTPCEQRRDYVYAGDVADAMAMAAYSDAEDCMLDVASGDSLPLWQFINEILDVAHEKRLPNYGALPYRAGEIFQHEGDPAPINKAIGWTAATPLHDGVSRMYKWFKDNINIYNN